MKNKITGILTLAALTAVFTAGCSKKENPVAGGKTIVKAVTTARVAPYTFIDEAGNVTGSDIEIVRAIFDRLPQYELKLEVGDALQGVLSGQYDFAVNNYGYAEKRAESYYYSYPYKVGYDVYIQRKGDRPIISLSDLAARKYKTEVGPGSFKAIALERWNETHPDEQISLIYSDANFQVKFQNIVDGKSDVAIDDGPIFKTLIPKFGLEDKLVPNPLSASDRDFFINGKDSTGSYLLFTKDSKGLALRNEINVIIKQLKKDGTLSKITTKYFERDTSPADEKFEKTLN